MRFLDKKETYTAKGDFPVSSFVGQKYGFSSQLSRPGYYLSLGPSGDWFTPTQAKALIREIESHLKRIEAHKLGKKK